MRGALEKVDLKEKSRILIIIGPEGGFSAGEVEDVRKTGGISVSLGPGFKDRDSRLCNTDCSFISGRRIRRLDNGKSCISYAGM